jgi:AAA domain/Winged helix-turn-helix DNA-binding
VTHAEHPGQDPHSVLPRLRVVTESVPLPDEPPYEDDAYELDAPALPAVDVTSPAGIVLPGDPFPTVSVDGRPVTAWSADTLMALDFPEPRWAVPGIIAEGVTLLCGPPKAGKSWMSLGLGLSIAAGAPALGSIKVQAGPVLYLALEDTPRRLKSRMGMLLDGQPAPADLTLVTTCPPLPQGGAERIAAWVERNPAARMVVLDVFAKMRGIAPPGLSAYDADYHAIGYVKRIADRFGIAVVLVHHVRKSGAEDFLETVSGTNGVAGAADAIMVLSRPRGQSASALHVTGRDIDEAEYALEFDPDSGLWRLLDGPADEHLVHDTRATILRHLRANPGQRPGDIAAALELKPDTVRQTCKRMCDAGQLRRDAGGLYFADEPPAGLLPGMSRPLADAGGQQ